MTIFSPQILARRRRIAVVTGSVNYDFTTGSLPGGVTLTRASSGTRINVSGLLVNETTNVARFDYSPTSIGTILGLLIEPSRTNDILQSEVFGTTWAGASVNSTNPSYVADQFSGADGNTTADQVGFGALNDHTSVSVLRQTIPNTGLCVGSVWVRAVGSGDAGKILTLYFNDNGTTKGVLNYTLTQTQTRIDTSATMAGGGTMYFNISSLGTDYGGTQTTQVSFATYLWGADVKVNSAAVDSYVQTTSAAVTRAADVCSFTIPAGVTTLLYTFDDNSTQSVGVSPGAYTIPTNLNRSRIKTIVG